MTENNHPANLAFSLAQVSMGSALKNAKNPFLKNKYADLTAIQNAVYPAFHANGFAIMQLPNQDEFGEYVETVFTHVSGPSFSGRVYLAYKSGDMQSKGGAITYARRYGLAAVSFLLRMTMETQQQGATSQRSLRGPLLRCKKEISPQHRHKWRRLFIGVFVL